MVLETYEDYDLGGVAKGVDEGENVDGNLVESLFFRFFRSFLEVADWCVLAFAMIVFMQTFCFRSMNVVGPSMQNTLQNKDGVCVFNMPWNFKRNDIVIVNEYSCLGKTIIKRVIATEGQVVNIDGNGDVYVDGNKLDEPYVYSTRKTERKPFLKYPLKVGKGQLFVLGDHRDVSGDSRDLGCINYSNVVGRVFLRWWPLGSFRLF